MKASTGAHRPPRAAADAPPVIFARSLDPRSPSTGAPAAAPSLTVTSRWRSGGSVPHTAAASPASSLTGNASCPDTIASAFTAGRPGSDDADQTLQPLEAATPPATPAHPTAARQRRVAADPSNEPGSSPTLPSISRHSSATPPSRSSTEHAKLNVAQLARRRHQPHPLRQRIHNMSSASPTRPAPARPTWRSRSAIKACQAGHRVAFATAHNGSTGSKAPSTATRLDEELRGSTDTACSSSTRSATSRSTARPPTCSSRSSPAATNAARSSSPPTAASKPGAKSSATPWSPPPSSTGSFTTPR